MTFGLLPGARPSVILQRARCRVGDLFTPHLYRTLSSSFTPGGTYPMRILIDQTSYDEMLSKTSPPRDCYVRGTEYLHHVYLDGVKYLVARAVYDCIKRAQEADDGEALLHLMFHKEELERMVADARAKGVDLRTARAIGDPPPTD